MKARPPKSLFESGTLTLYFCSNHVFSRPVTNIKSQTHTQANFFNVTPSLQSREHDLHELLKQIFRLIEYFVELFRSLLLSN